MKTNYLLTAFLFSLSLTSSSILINIVPSAIANQPNNKTTTEKTVASPKNSVNSKDGKKVGDKNDSKASDKDDSKASDKDDSKASDKDDSKASDKDDSKSSDKDDKRNSTESSPLPWIFSIMLHAAEIAAIILSFLKISLLNKKNLQLSNITFKLGEKSRDYEAQINRLSEKSDKKQKLINPGGANTPHTKPRRNESEQPPERKKQSTTSYDGIPDAPPIVVLPDPPPATSNKSAYPFLDIYRQSFDNFKQIYEPEVVSEDATNLQKRWAGDQHEIILVENRQGNYWVFKEDRQLYLIPSPKLKVIDMNMRTVGGLFTCKNYVPKYQKMTVIHPAIVTSQNGSDKQWKIEQKGVLEFT